MNKNELSRLREIPLEAVLQSFGAEPDPADPKRNWKTPAGRITITETKFYNHDLGEGGGGAIDLTMHLGGFSFPDALAHLGNIAGHVATINQYQVEAVKHAKRILDTTPAPKHEIPAPDGSKLNRVREYLTDGRAIPESVVEKAVAKGRLWADRFGNAVFALFDSEMTGAQVGVELRGTYDKPFHGVRGEKKGMFFTGNARSDAAVFVESAIDALSYEAVHPNSLVVSTTGAGKDALMRTAAVLHDRGYKLVAAFDNDKDGDRYSRWLSDTFANVERHVPPTGKDWNEYLQQRRRDHEQAAHKQPDAGVKQQTTRPVAGKDNHEVDR
jgi:hypothetical protein